MEWVDITILYWFCCAVYSFCWFILLNDGESCLMSDPALNDHQFHRGGDLPSTIVGLSIVDLLCDETNNSC